MFTNFPFFPQQASEQAATIDALYFFLLAVTAFFAALIAILVAVFATKFHRKHDDEVGEVIHGSLALELLWTIIPLGITMVMFVWGAQVFTDLACITCHVENGQGRGPVLRGSYGRQVLLEGGQTTTFDDAYIRESILNPHAKVVAGFQPIMPTFQGLVTEEQLLQLIAYVKSLGATPAK